MNEITREMIKNGFENGIISIENDYGGCISICCKIGILAFYFQLTDFSDEELNIDEYKKKYSLDEIVENIYQTICDEKTARENGIYSDEWNYYKEELSNEN